MSKYINFVFRWAIDWAALYAGSFAAYTLSGGSLWAGIGGAVAVAAYGFYCFLLGDN